MARRQGFSIGRILQRREIARWKRRADLAETADPGPLRQLRTDARALRQEVDRALRTADTRLDLARNDTDDQIERPWGCDWAWRPELWSTAVFPAGITAPASGTGLGDEVRLFHDCTPPEIALRQITNSEGAAPFGAALDVFGFGGTFLSLVLDLPGAGVSGLRRNHLIRVAMKVKMERPLSIYVRLNVLHGPNTEQIVRELPVASGDHVAEFDLAYTKMNEKRVEKAWIDLIFANPAMNRVVLHDLTCLRHPRADI